MALTKAARVEYIQRELERLYPVTPIPLDHRDAFTLNACAFDWVAVLV